MRYFLDIHGQPVTPLDGEYDHADLARRVLPDELVATLDYAGLYAEMFRRGYVRVVEERDCLLAEAEDAQGRSVPFHALAKAQQEFLLNKAAGLRFIYNSKDFKLTREDNGASAGTAERRFWLDRHGEELRPVGNEVGHHDIARRVLGEERLHALKSGDDAKDYEAVYRAMFTDGCLRVLVCGFRVEVDTGSQAEAADITAAQASYFKNLEAAQHYVVIDSQSFLQTRDTRTTP